MAIDLNIMNEVICSCGRVIFEVDANFCHGCGDVMCKECYTDCFTCGKMYCPNCSQSPTRCLKCDLEKARPKVDEKAFLVLDGKVNVATPIKNSAFMIKTTSYDNARNITLELAGDKYRYCYRQMVLSEQDKFDYFMYFEKIVETEVSNSTLEKIRNAYDSYMADGDYDDYGNPWVGW